MGDGGTLFPFVFFFPSVIYCTKCTSDHKLMEVNFQFSIFNFLHAIKIVLGRTASFLKKKKKVKINKEIKK